MLLYKLAATGFAAFFDFAVGAFIVSLISLITNHEIAWWQCFIGGILGLAPDLDVIYMYLNRGKVYGNHHEFVTHRPLFGVGIAALIGYLFGGVFWVIAAGTCLCWHYIHDTEGLGGGGIAWLWPLSSKYLSLSGFKNANESAAAKWVGKHKDFLESWLAPSKKSVSEITIGSLCIGLAGIRSIDLLFGVALTVSIIIFVAFTWILYKGRELAN